MRVGLQKSSLIDFPGRVAAVVFLPGCNFACPYCHNPGLVSNVDIEALADWPEVLGHLSRRRGLLSGVVFSGGEPCLHGDLPVLAGMVRSLGYAVKLDTNGSRPDAILPVGADYIAMDLKTSPGRYSAVWPGAPADAESTIMESMRAVRSSGAAYEFRVTCAPGIFGEEEARELASCLEPADPVVLQRYRPGVVLDPAWAAGTYPYLDAQMDRLLAIVSGKAPLARLRSA